MLYLFSALWLPLQRVSAWGRMDIPLFSHASPFPSLEVVSLVRSFRGPPVCFPFLRWWSRRDSRWSALRGGEFLPRRDRRQMWSETKWIGCCEAATCPWKLFPVGSFVESVTVVSSTRKLFLVRSFVGSPHCRFFSAEVVSCVVLRRISSLSFRLLDKVYFKNKITRLSLYPGPRMCSLY